MATPDELTYGVVLTRLAAGEWWHGHLVRSNVQYDCALLGRRTTMLFVVQRFRPGGVANSDRFLLTLDGEGIGDPGRVRVTADWGEVSGGGREPAAARTIRETVMPLLHRDATFQHAVWFIVDHLEHETIADPGEMHPMDRPPFAAEG